MITTGQTLMSRVTALPLGTRFRYAGHERVYVLIYRHDCGVCAVWTDAEADPITQEVFSVAESKAEFTSLEVEVAE